MVVVVNGDAVEVADGASVADLLDQLGLARRTIVVERNGEPVPRRELRTTALADGGRLELLGGGAGGGPAPVADRSDKLGHRRLYLCTPDRPDLAEFVRRCIDGGVDVVQLRDHTL